MSGKALTDLMTVCGHCHHWTEFSQAGKKLTVKHATKKLRGWRYVRRTMEEDAEFAEFKFQRELAARIARED